MVRLYWKGYALVYPGQLVSADLRRPRFIGRRSHSCIHLKGPGKIKGIGKAAGKRRVFHGEAHLQKLFPLLQTVMGNIPIRRHPQFPGKRR